MGFYSPQVIGWEVVGGASRRMIFNGASARSAGENLDLVGRASVPSDGGNFDLVGRAQCAGTIFTFYGACARSARGNLDLVGHLRGARGENLHFTR